MYKPELLLPVGNVEMFYAAIEGGADAVYAGVRKFNARNRAKNFSFTELYNVCEVAKKNNKKVYITLNTLIKNDELSELLETLHLLNQCGVDALIIQDLALLNITRKVYPKFEIHASTQFGIHNSGGVEFLRKQGVKRSILSREVNLMELEQISRNKNSSAKLEIFVHGALCYSFSGQCLFSSYIGGYSANRGMCAQVCRRNFISNKQSGNIFSLKDLQLIDYIPVFSDLKIKSLKVEGRMKSPDYVFKTAKAYRMVIDDHSKIAQAKEILQFDYAREKTAWFIGKKLDDAFTVNSGAGLFAGKIIKLTSDGFALNSEIELLADHRLRCRNLNDTEAKFVNVIGVGGDQETTFVVGDNNGLAVGDEVYVTGKKHKSFSHGSGFSKSVKRNSLSKKQSEKLISLFNIAKTKPTRIKWFLRTSDTSCINTSVAEKFDAIILKLDYKRLEQFLKFPIDGVIKSKLILELPKFISETQLEKYRKIFAEFFSKKFRRISISHISQIEMLPVGSEVWANESVYALNDIAIAYMKNLGIKEFVFPFESEYPNLLRGRDRSGIIPIYFHPELFYSRMPVRSDDSVKDESGVIYKKTVKNGFTIICPEKPVSFTQSVSKFKSKGFSKFLIDMSAEVNCSNLEKVLKAAQASVKLPSTSDFNMKKGLR
jgi:putative protease